MDPIYDSSDAERIKSGADDSDDSDEEEQSFM